MLEKQERLLRRDHHSNTSSRGRRPVRTVPRHLPINPPRNQLRQPSSLQETIKVGATDSPGFAYHCPVNYDLIGDIHGHSEPLLELLQKLDYRATGGVFRHPDRKVIFLGDFIDRGPRQHEVIEIVRPMIDEGAALSVMGNHEFNAIAYFTPDPDDPGKHLRVHSNKNQNQHAVFLDAYDGSDSYPEIISWFRTLPLWLDLPGLRVVHACWDERLMQFLLDRYPTVNQYLDDDLLVRASRKDAEEYKAIETLLKGKEVAMPAGLTFNDKDGNPRHHVRVRWFDGEPRTYREAFFGPESARSHIPEDPIDTDYLIEYTKDGPPVFVGHYWLDDELNVLAPNVACLDYSVAARSGGRLVAYRWDGEQQLSKDKFEFVLRAAD